MNRPKLTIEEQITDMQKEGITFNHFTIVKSIHEKVGKSAASDLIQKRIGADLLG